METEKCRSKALKTASAEKGVSSISVNSGENKLEVIGENVNLICLLNQLCKKFRCLKLHTVEELKPPQLPPPPEQPQQNSPHDDDDGDSSNYNNQPVPTVLPPPYQPPCPWYPYYYRHPDDVVVVYDSYNDGYGHAAGCSIS
ncbi:hypothetical protein PIB30_005791 [Stylosanthes scabra]|uniref:HMA domain-containing protein n=1 Tax=Stylosanthes scabra TaxID=79078 RepID=A0ABU6X5T3_9FABA|nr:hypothetical protein [Stylosanthes scabra]